MNSLVSCECGHDDENYGITDRKRAREPGAKGTKERMGRLMRTCEFGPNPHGALVALLGPDLLKGQIPSVDC